MVFDKPKIIINSPVTNLSTNDENNPNINNISGKKLNESANKYETEEDALFNISDSVLKDVTL